MSTTYRKSASSVNQTENHEVSKGSSSQSGNTTDSASSIGGKTRITCPLTVVNGLDTLKIGLWLVWSNTAFFDELTSLKNCVQQSEEETIPYHAPGGFDWNVHRTGKSRYTFRLTSGDLTLFFNRRLPEAIVPTARLEIGSISCWSPGYYHTLFRVLEWLRFLGGSLKKMKISEVHLAADVVGADIRKLQISDEDRWISYAHKFSIYRDRRKLSGITYGSGDLMLRVYDKVLELQHSGHKQIVFSEIWNSSPYNKVPVTRVEFQLRREVLREFGEDSATINGLVKILQSIWNYCINDWARFCASKVNRNHNQSKARTSEFWALLSTAKWEGSHEIQRKKRRQCKDFDQILNNLIGSALTASAFADPHPEDFDHIVKLAVNYVEAGIRQKYKEDLPTFIEKMTRKRNEIFTNI